MRIRKSDDGRCWVGEVDGQLYPLPFSGLATSSELKEAYPEAIVADSNCGCDFCRGATS